MTSVPDERGREVLETLIQLHIAGGEPVGSESLASALGRRFSPATLRNVMADLERMGYLDHPHTSAGRLPTDEGYRFYVDSLSAQPELRPQELAEIASGLRSAEGTTSVLETASQVLSRLSRNVGFVVAPDLGQATFAHVDLVRLMPPRVLAVLVSATGLVTQKVISLEDDLSQDDLQTCANYLNAHFAGLSLSAIRERLLELMRADQAQYDELLQKVCSIGARAFAAQDAPASVYLDGASNILGRPEFEDVDRMRALFKTFEQKGRLIRILNACIAGEGVRIVIGHENPDPDLRNVALVTTGLHGEPGFGLGVMGSTRMEYPRVIALVEHVARAVQQALTEFRA
jgi:heat-inducible transcriptional repressor